MSGLRRRLQKLEAQLTDRSGLVPESPRWMEYWRHRIENLIAEAAPMEPEERIPLQAVRAFMRSAESD
jgi:hypothetical protein